jgi:hypothetical protein
MERGKKNGVVVRVEEGSIKCRVFFSTDPSLSVQEILEGYARRWAIEVCFRDLKQLLGFADSSARKRAVRKELVRASSPRDKVESIVLRTSQAAARARATRC